MALCLEHPKRDQNPKFTPLRETTSIPVCFIWESPPRVLYRQTEAPELKRVMKSLKQRFYGNNDSFEYKEITPKEIKLTDLNVGLSITVDHCSLLKLFFIFTAKAYPRIPLCPSSGSFVPRFLPIRHPGLQYQGRH